jgi:hypothetical protein
MSAGSRRASKLAVFPFILGYGVSAVSHADQPDFTKIRGAIVVVVAKGIVPSQGNAPIASQGTGFFVSKDGFLVTSNHVRTDLVGVDDGTITYEIHFGPTSPDVVAAAPVFVNPAADVLVLYAPVGDRDVPILSPGNRTEVSAGITKIYTVGYPSGYQFSIDEGIVKSFGGLIAPVPAWTTNLNFKAGQSGSPIILANMHVIAIAKGNDADAASIGLVVPSRLVPDNYWDGTTVANAALVSGSLEGVTRVSVQGIVPTSRPVKRETEIDLKNDACAGTSTKNYHVSASAGWKIDEASIDVKPVRTVGSSVKYVLTDRDPTGFTVAVELSNVGQCIKLPTLLGSAGGTIQSGVPAEFQGRATYVEVPDAPTPQLTTFASEAVLGKSQTPLPNLPLSDLQFSLATPQGQVKTFVPVPSELATKAGITYLDAGKAAARVLESK